MSRLTLPNRGTAGVVAGLFILSVGSSCESPARNGRLPERTIDAGSVGELDLTLEETIRLGTSDEGFVNGVTDIAFSDSLIFVLDGFDQSVKLFDSDTGRLMRRFGQRGEGPGEFRYPMAIEVWKDTVYVVDPSLGPELQVFSTEGDFLGERRIDVPGTPADLSISDHGLAVVVLLSHEENPGDSHIARLLSMDGSARMAWCEIDGRFLTSEREQGLLDRMRQSNVTATVDAVACIQPISPAIQLLSSDTIALNLVPPFYREPLDRPFEGVTQPEIFDFLSSWTAHNNSYVWDDGFISVYSEYDLETQSFSFSIFRCLSVPGGDSSCAQATGLGNVVAVPNLHTIYVEEIEDADRGSALRVFTIGS